MGSELKGFRRSAHELHSINHVYRDAITRQFSLQESSKEKIESSIELQNLLLVERAILSVICLKITNIYSNLIRHKCTVTVKLMADKNQKKVCFTWARSEHQIERDRRPEDGYDLEENTGFKKALEDVPGRPSHFFSADLIKDFHKGNYHNTRGGWQHFYKSTIVVPIRHKSESEPQKADVVGFLCLDTNSRNRLNDGYHVELLAAFADQMYNFINIMRRRLYLPPVERMEGITP
jgi:hypothetical protein